MMSLRSIALVAVLSIFLVLGSCGGSDEPQASTTTLQRGIGTDAESLDNHKARSTQAADILRDIGEGLTGYTPTGELVPTGATSWEVSEDGLTYTFTLRDEARWSTGEPVTAHDFVYGMRRLVNPATAAFYAEMLISLENAQGILSGEIPVSMLGVEAVDDYTLVLRLVQPTPYLLALLTHPSTFPMHAASIEEHGDSFARPGNLVSNGAYYLEAWVPGSIISLKRNEQYWNNAAVAIDAVNYHVLTQPGSETNRYRAGELHTTSNVAAELFAQVREERPDELRVAPNLGVYYYGFNLTKEPFKDNPALREALSMAIDREELTESVVGRGEKPAYGWVPPGVNNYTPATMGFAALGKEEREQLARVRYREAGYDEENPLQVEIRYNTGDTHRKIAIAVQAMWKDVLGAEVTLINEEFQVLLANVRDAEVTQVFRLSWIGDYNDAQTFLGVFRGGNPSNLPRYSSEQYDDLMERAAAHVDAERRRIYLEQAERVLIADHPVIPLYFYVSKHLVSPQVSGWGDNVLDYHYSQHLSLSAPE